LTFELDEQETGGTVGRSRVAQDTGRDAEEKGHERIGGGIFHGESFCVVTSAGDTRLTAATGGELFWQQEGHPLNSGERVSHSGTAEVCRVERSSEVWARRFNDVTP
jgi:hypothetical protein